MDAYPTSKVNKVRKSDRAAYDHETVHAIIDAAPIAHVGFVDNDWPMVMPMIVARIGETLYLHGARAARFAKTLGQGVPVCVTVTHLDGLVLARSAFHSSVNYRSVVAHCMARQVDDPDEKARALAAVTDHLAPGRWDEARETTAKEYAATGVIAAEIQHAAAKVRTGGPVDDDEDYALPIWAGVIPIRQAMDTPYDDGRVPDGVPVPESARKAMARNT